MMKSKVFWSYAVVPLLLTATGTAVYLAVVNSWNYELMAYGLFLFTMLYLLVFERIVPLKQAWKIKRQSLSTDLRHLLLSTAIFDALGKAVAIAVVLQLHSWFAPQMAIWEKVPFALSFIIANIIGEFLPYLYHRYSHVGALDKPISRFLWQVHSIHHLPESMNWLKTSWIHPINMFLNTLLKLLPLFWLGFGESIIFAVAVLHAVVSYLSHANLDARTGWLDYLIVTPQVHHFHHSKKLEEAQNFGGVLPFWDLVFGTYYNRRGSVEAIGVVANEQLQYPEERAYWRQLLFPVGWKVKCC